MAADIRFTPEEMAVDEVLGHPVAFAKLCRDRSFRSYNYGPPYAFVPYALPETEASRAKELEELFPIIDPKAKPTVKPKIFATLLWKQLNHLGNAGFDPEQFRIDQYGNVLYYHADPASPLAWEIDHLFPCSRGGLTVPSNLRILQWQVCKKKHQMLEFLIPWWDLQLGISVNQFLSIFASSNSDFRHRAFSMLFLEGENEELNASQTVDSHSFPQHFIESKANVGLAPAAIVSFRKESIDALSTLDINRPLRSMSPAATTRRMGAGALKANENRQVVSNHCQSIVVVTDPLRQKEETAKMQAEIQRLDDEVAELKRAAEEEKVTIQDLELLLIKRRRRAEKFRRLTETQSSYRVTLEKMIRDAMHQSVVYKEQVRLNQAATSALMARLEAQKAICDASERDLHKKFEQRDELEKQIKHVWDQTRKRSRLDDSLSDEKNDKIVLYLPESKPDMHIEKELDGNLLQKPNDKMTLSLPEIEASSCASHKELRNFFEQDKGCKAAVSLEEKEWQQDEAEDDGKDKKKPKTDGWEICNVRFPVFQEPEKEEDDECRRERGKGNVEKWLQILLENSEEPKMVDIMNDVGKDTSRSEEIIKKLNLVYPHQKLKNMKFTGSEDEEETQRVRCQEKKQKKSDAKNDSDKEHDQNWNRGINKQKKRDAKNDSDEVHDQNWNGGINKVEAGYQTLRKPPYQVESENSKKEVVDQCAGVGIISNDISDAGSKRRESNGKEKVLKRSESARGFRRIPSSPSLIQSMRKGVDFMRKKPQGAGDDNGIEGRTGANFLKSSIKTLKKAVKM